MLTELTFVPVLTGVAVSTELTFVLVLTGMEVLTELTFVAELTGVAVDEGVRACPSAILPEVSVRDFPPVDEGVRSCPSAILPEVHPSEVAFKWE